MGAIATRYETGNSTKQKQRRTNEHQLDHFIQFCQSLDVDASLRGLDHNDQTIVAILYLHHIAGGNTILGHRCQLDTIKGYMKAMIEFVQLPSNAGRDITKLSNPSKPMYLWNEHHLISAIYNEVHTAMARYCKSAGWS